MHTSRQALGCLQPTKDEVDDVSVRKLPSLDKVIDEALRDCVERLHH